MAYTTRLERAQCHYPSCQALAIVTVFNCYNAPTGTYCNHHGDKAKAMLNRQEDQQTLDVIRAGKEREW